MKCHLAELIIILIEGPYKNKNTEAICACVPHYHHFFGFHSDASQVVLISGPGCLVPLARGWLIFWQ